MTFVEPSGEEHEVEFMEDDTILDVALDNDIEIEGACGGECERRTWLPQSPAPRSSSRPYLN